MFNQDQIRREQTNEGQRRSTLSTSGSRGASSQKKPFVAKGHDAILKGIQDTQGRIIIVTVGDGTEHIGSMVARDKYTITIQTDTGSRKTFYKHAIESFEPIRVQ